MQSDYLHVLVTFVRPRMRARADLCRYVVIRGGFRVAKDFIHSPPVLAKAEELAFMEAGDVVGETGALMQTAIPCKRCAHFKHAHTYCR